MTKPTPNTKALEPEIRAQVIRELSDTMERLALDIPHADAAMIVKMAIGFFAGVHAEHFGHVETARILTRTARLGLSLAQAEFQPAPETCEETSH